MANVKKRKEKPSISIDGFSTELPGVINSLQEYFTNKIMMLDFTVKKVSLYVVTIEIDGYTFLVWTCSGPVHMRTYGEFDGERNFMELPFKDNREAIYEALMQNAKRLYDIENRMSRVKELHEIQRELDMYVKEQEV